MSASENDEAMFVTLLSYRKMALDNSKHHTIMKDKTMVQFIAYSLDSLDGEVVETALQTIELLVQNQRNHSVLHNTYGLIEALKSLENRDDLVANLRELAADLCTRLESESPAYCTRSRTKPSAELPPGDKVVKIPSKVYIFHVFGLNQDTRCDLEHYLVRLNGVISVVVDVDHQRVTVRVSENLTPEELARKIHANTDLEAQLVIRNKLNQELLKNMLVSKEVELETVGEDSGDGLPPYLTEEDSPVKEKALLSLSNIRDNASTWIKTATSFLQNSFYW